MYTGHCHQEDTYQVLIPLAYFFLKRSNERRALHRHGLHDVVLEQYLDVVEGREDADVSVLVGHKGEGHVAPVVTHLGQRLKPTYRDHQHFKDR